MMSENKSGMESPNQTKGIAELKAALEKTADVIDMKRKKKIPKSSPSLRDHMIPLGMHGGSAVVYSYSMNSLVYFGSYKSERFYCVAPFDYWANEYPTERGSVNWELAKSDVARMNIEEVAYDSTRVRGTGVWLDEGNIVFNSGDCIFVNGEKIQMRDMKSRFVYVSDVKLSLPTAEPATDEELKDVITLIKGLSWIDSRMGIYLMGWLVAAPLAGMLPVRPHIWLTGSSQAGKSTVQEEIAKRLVPFMNEYLGSTTEAGFRQFQRGNGVPAIFDEFETNDGPHSAARIQGILELFRQSFSPTAAPIIKGSQSGSPQLFSANFCGLVSSIRVSLSDEADINRFTVIELTANKREEFRKVERFLKLINVDLKAKLWSRIFANCKIVLQNYDIFKSALRKTGKTDRCASKIAMLLAGYALWESTAVVDQNAAARILDEAKDIDGDADATESDPEAFECWRHLLTSKVRVASKIQGTGETDVTVGFAINGAMGDSPDNLLHHGVAFLDNDILIAHSHRFIRGIYANTKWANSFVSILKRLPGAKSLGKTHRFKDISCKATRIPKSLL